MIKSVTATVKLNPDELVSKLREFGYKTITVMKDEKNYLMFDYMNDPDMTNVLAVENFDKEVLFVKEYSCGYGGYGPGKTEEFLVKLGISEKEARRLKFKDGFKLEFDETGKIVREYNFFPFGRERGKIDLRSNKILCDLENNQVYFLEPQDELSQLLACLDLIHIKDVLVYVGSNGNEYYDFALPYYPTSPSVEYNKRILKGSFIVFCGSPFTVVCFVGIKAPLSIINTLFTYTVGEPLFREEKLGKYIVLNQENGKKVKVKGVFGRYKDIYLRFKDIKRSGAFRR